jgi:hypothetical protein
MKRIALVMTALTASLVLGSIGCEGGGEGEGEGEEGEGEGEEGEGEGEEGEEGEGEEGAPSHPASTPWDFGITIRIPFTFLYPAPFHSFATLNYPSPALQQNPFPFSPGNTSPNTVQYVRPLY